MANIVFNNALGRVAEKVENSADIRVLLLQAADSDAVLKDVDTVAALLALGGTTEANFASYARQQNINSVRTVNDTTDTVNVDCDDIQWVNATAGQNIVAAVFFRQVTNDADSIPLTKHDAVFTTNGSTVTLQTPNGYYGAT